MIDILERSLIRLARILDEFLNKGKAPYISKEERKVEYNITMDAYNKKLDGGSNAGDISVPRPLRCNNASTGQVKRMVMLIRAKISINATCFKSSSSNFFEYSSNKEILILHKALPIINENCFMLDMVVRRMDIP